jgi:ATP-binding cassette subfamily B protein
MNKSIINKRRPQTPSIYLGFLFPYRYAMTTVAILTVVIAAVELLPPLLTRRLVDEGLKTPHLYVVESSTIGIGITVLLVALLDIFQGWYYAIASEGAIRDLRCKVVNHLASLPVSFFSYTPRGEITNRVTGDIEIIRLAMSRGLINIMTKFCDILTVVIAMVLLDWKLSLTAIIVPIFTVPAIVLQMRKMSKLSLAVNSCRDDLSSVIHRIFSHAGIHLLKSFGAESLELQRIGVVNEAVFKARTANGWSSLLLQFWLVQLVVFAPAIIWIVGGYEYFHNAASLGTILAITTFSMRLYSSIATVNIDIYSAISAVTAYSKILEILRFDPESSEVSATNEGFTNQPEINALAVSAKYDTSDFFSLIDFTFKFKSPGFYAFVGPSGSGKSSFVSVLVRFLAVHTGHLEICGASITKLCKTSVREMIALASQDAFLKNATIAENVRYGVQTKTNMDFDEASKASLVSEFIDELPDGWNFPVGERGRNLSGGQRQRVSIMRALLKDAPILILDEALSELDIMMEQRIIRAIRTLYADKIIFMITHRFSTISDADQILVVAGGSVVESGTHFDLIRSGGIYADMFDKSKGRGDDAGVGA